MPAPLPIRTDPAELRRLAWAGGSEAVLDAAWNALLTEPGRLRSLTSYPWLPTSITSS
jgi:hypothetical protein